MQSAVLTKPAPDLKETKAQSGWLFAAVASTAALVIVFGVMVWGLDKGFDVNVEGDYMLSLQRPEQYLTFTSFHLMLSKIPNLVGNQIIHYRIMEAVARILPTTFLVVAFAAWVKPVLKLNGTQKVTAVTFAVIGALMSMAVFPRTISYNGVTYAFIVLSFGCALLGTADESPVNAGWRRKAWLVGAGILAAFTFFVKFTSGTAIAALELVFLLAQRRKLKEALLLPAGILFGFAAYFVLFQSPIDWWKSTYEAVYAELRSSHSANGMVSNLQQFIGGHVMHLVLLLGSCTAILIYMRNASAAIKTNFARYLCFAFSILVIGLGVSAYYYKRDVYVAIYAMEMFAILLLASRPLGAKMWIGLISLALLPVTASFGTNCPLLAHMASVMGPWFLLVAISAFAVAENLATPRTMACVIFSMVVYSTMQFMNSYIYERYDCAPLVEQCVTVQKPEILKGLKMDERSQQFYEQAEKTLYNAGFRQGDYILSLYDAPGLVYVMNGISPGQAWYVSWPERDHLNAHFFKTFKLDPTKNIFLAVYPNAAIKERMLLALKKQGLPFPAAWNFVAMIDHPQDRTEQVYFYKALNPAERAALAERIRQRRARRLAREQAQIRAVTSSINKPEQH